MADASTSSPSVSTPPVYTPPEWLQPEAAKLKGDTLKAAVEGQILTYPQVVRSQLDPTIAGQLNGNLSFMLFDKPKVTKMGKPIYGFVKMRGNWNDPATAKREAIKIVKETDSKFPVKIVQVGTWIPITEDETFVKDMVDVKASDQQPQLRDESIKKKEEDARDKMRQIKDREEQLRKDGDIYDNPESLGYYTMKRVTEMKVVEMIDTLEKRLADLKEKIVIVRDDLCDLDAKYPEYAEQWVARYDEERAKSGIPGFIAPANQFEDYEAHKKVRKEAEERARKAAEAVSKE